MYDLYFYNFQILDSLSALDMDVTFARNPQELNAQLDLNINFDIVFIDQVYL